VGRWKKISRMRALRLGRARPSLGNPRNNPAPPPQLNTTTRSQHSTPDTACPPHPPLSKPRESWAQILTSARLMTMRSRFLSPALAYVSPVQRCTRRVPGHASQHSFSSVQQTEKPNAELANTRLFLAFPSPVSFKSLMGDREVSPAVPPTPYVPNS